MDWVGIGEHICALSHSVNQLHTARDIENGASRELAAKHQTWNSQAKRRQVLVDRMGGSGKEKI